MRRVHSRRCGRAHSGPVTIVPHSNWRGQYHAGSYTDGAAAGNSRLDLREVRWLAENAGAYLNPLRPFRRDAPWMDSLVQSSEDASGLMYRRNRYYDPKTGRFTQEDPTGSILHGRSRWIDHPHGCQEQ
jgi:uncharacterized protein RhaS with RHS repeats